MSQGSKVTSFLRSDKGQRCMETVARVVTVMQTGLSERERHIRKRQEETASKQVRPLLFYKFFFYLGHLLLFSFRVFKI